VDPGCAGLGQVPDLGDRGLSLCRGSGSGSRSSPVRGPQTSQGLAASDTRFSASAARSSQGPVPRAPSPQPVASAGVNWATDGPGVTCSRPPSYTADDPFAHVSRADLCDCSGDEGVAAAKRRPANFVDFVGEGRGSHALGKARVETERRVDALSDEVEVVCRSREKVFKRPPIE
jgi:hypothetical protein